MSGACFASDIWSLGCTIVELLTGKPPYADLRESMSGRLPIPVRYRANTLVMFRIVKDDMPPLPTGLSGELNDFLQTCFKKDPATRPAAQELFDHVWLKRYCPDLVSLPVPYPYDMLIKIALPPSSRFDPVPSASEHQFRSTIARSWRERSGSTI